MSAIAEIQVEFELSAKAREGSDLEQAGAERTARMWSLMSKQFIAGLGAPRESQLAAVFDKYAGGGVASSTSRGMSKGDLASAMRDYALSRHEEISKARACIQHPPPASLLMVRAHAHMPVGLILYANRWSCPSLWSLRRPRRPTPSSRSSPR